MLLLAAQIVVGGGLMPQINYWPHVSQKDASIAKSKRRQA